MSLEYVPDLCRVAPDAESPLIAQYQAIADASRSMLEAARQDDWVEVARQEQICRNLIDRLSAAKLADPSPIAENVKRIALLRAILSDDAEIRDRSEPWMRTIEKMLAARSRPFA